MKKVFLSLCLVFVLMFSVALCSCNKADAKGIPSDVSYVESEVFWGCSDGFFVEIAKGCREVPLNADGRPENVQMFIEIKLTPSKVIDADALRFVLCGENGTAEDSAALSVIQNTYIFTAYGAAELGKLNSIEITVGENRETAELSNILEGKLGWEDVLKIARDEFKNRTDESGGTREIFVKVVRDRRALGGDFFWYVSFVGGGADFWSLLINPENGNIIAKK